MKTQNTLNALTYAVIILGLFFKFQHWPGANILLIVSFVSLFALAVRFALSGPKESGMNSMLHYLLSFMLIVFIGAGLFKVMHWPGGDVMQLLGYILAFLVPLVLIFQKDTFHIPSNYFIMFAMFFAFYLFIIPNNPFANALGLSKSDFSSEQTRQTTEQVEAASATTDSMSQAAPAAEEGHEHGHEHAEGEGH